MSVFQKTFSGIFLWFLSGIGYHAFASCTAAINGNTYSLWTASDSGPGSLRQAILDANSDGTGGTIENYLSGGTITLLSPLPVVTADSLYIGWGFFSDTVFISGNQIITGPPLNFTTQNSCYNDDDMFFIDFLPGTYTVSNTNDDGPGSLRQAIKISNQSDAADFIAFNIPGTAPHKINLTSDLPALTNPAILDGSTQPANGYTGNAPRIEVDGSFAGSDYGITVNASNCEIYGFFIHDFNWGITTSGPVGYTDSLVIGSINRKNVISGNGAGLRFLEGNGLFVEGNYWGTDTSGTLPYGNAGTAIELLDSVSNCIIKDNLISGNHTGIFSTAEYVTIQGNKIGTDHTGTARLSNKNGIKAYRNNVTIGGANAGDGNLISGNTEAGIWAVLDSNFLVQGNMIGTDITGTDTISNEKGIRNACLYYNSVIGGYNPGEGNLISGNTIGIWSEQGVDIIGNKIGTDINGSTALANNKGIEYFSIGVQGGRVENNLISGNTWIGVHLFASPKDVLIKGNKVGTDAAGTAMLANDYGIVAAGENAIIDSNLISGNGKYGLYVATFKASHITNNKIGVDINDFVSLPNDTGVYLFGNDSSVIADNIIAHNTSDGIYINADAASILRNRIDHNGRNGVALDSGSEFVLISQNSIFNNSLRGIDLIGGANQSILPPEITETGTDTVRGTSDPFDRVELYYHESQNANPQGKTFIDSITADALGNWAYIGPIADKCNVTALAIDQNNNTSEFSGFASPNWQLELGPATDYCQDSVILNAGVSNAVYNWNTGDTTSFITIFNSGLYYVTVTDECNNTDSDSVMINVYPPNTVQTSNDTTICAGDTIRISVNQQASYSWSPLHHIDSPNVRMPRVWPDSSMAYIIIGYDANNCSATDTVSIMVDQDCVWPGDGNDDGVANHMDLLPIGIAYGYAGPPRPMASTNWLAQIAPAWVDTFASGLNQKHADCSGEGVINGDDTLVILQNYGLQHFKNGFVRADPSDSLLYAEIFRDSILTGDTLQVNINLGMDSLTVYGLAFSISYDPALVDSGSASVDFSTSWIGTEGIDMITLVKDFPDLGRTDIALTRTDHQNVTGYGKIAQFNIVMQDDISGKKDLSRRLHVGISDPLIIQKDASILPIYLRSDSVEIYEQGVHIAPKPRSDRVNSFLLYPNPALDKLHIVAADPEPYELRMLNNMGQQVISRPFIDQSTTVIALDGFATGLYLIELTTGTSRMIKKVIIADH